MELGNLLLFIDLTHKEEFSRLPLIQPTILSNNVNYAKLP